MKLCKHFSLIIEVENQEYQYQYIYKRNWNECKK
jgi:hypothetical protein